MKVCLISGELFAWGKYGGFGRATRTIGRELVKRGVEVCAVVPRRGEQKARETLDGIEVLGFPLWNVPGSFALYRACDADIYHSQEPSLGAWLAMLAKPDRKHVITFRDTRDAEDWAIELAMPSRTRWATYTSRLYENSWPVHRAARRADAVYCAAHCVGDTAQRVYELKFVPELLPTPVAMPLAVEKAKTPVVCCISRMDRRKRPELVLQLVPKFPDVRFMLIGPSQDQAWFNGWLQKYAHCPNLEYRGFVDQFQSTEIQETYSKSWILINAAAREGLPNTYLEAAAHSVAILSRTDPDGFASRFGCRIDNDDFEGGLRYLLEHDRWRERGRAGHAYVSEHYDISRAVDRHLAIYEHLLA